ncbi:sulfotransferase domain-containing protein [Actinomycetota bacterium]
MGYVFKKMAKKYLPKGKKLRRLIRHPGLLLKMGNLDLNFDINNTIMLAGSARSGTTWVANIINYNNEYRMMFEPFHPTRVDYCQILKNKSYISTENKDEELINLFKFVLSGRIRSLRINRYNTRWISKKRIIKEVTGNLFLKWLKINFPQVPIILLMRHPFSVAVSKIKLNFSNPDKEIEILFSQEKLVNDYLIDYRMIAKNLNSIFEKYVFIWCVENYIPIRQFRKDEIYISFYENLCLKSIEEVTRLFLFLNKEVNKKVINMIKIPSQTVKEHSSILTGDNLIHEWKKSVKKIDIEKGTKILKSFKLDKIYNERSIPDINELHKIMYY